tara:strand:- start:2597 stop:2755 length:159 start_codon:yes stop_codon:yes gene_type:complete
MWSNPAVNRPSANAIWLKPKKSPLVAAIINEVLFVHILPFIQPLHGSVDADD